MPFCPNCGRSVFPSDGFCYTCGRALQRTESPQGQSTTQAQTPQSYQTNFPPSVAKTQTAKSAWTAALLNLFLPGLGYVYNGLGRNSAETVMGILVFVFYFIGYGVAFVLTILTTKTTSSTTSSTSSPFAALIILSFLMPIAFAYDAYHRANRP